MRTTIVSSLVLTAVVLAGCGGESSDESVDDSPPTTQEATGADDTSIDGELAGLGGEIPLEVGDCWGLEDDVQVEPIPCDGPHIYEVAGIIEDWDHEQYEGSFEAGVAGDEAMMSACLAAATEYFSYDPIDAGFGVDHNEPHFVGHEDIVVCSAHSGPDVEYVEDEVIGSLADRGHR